MPGSPASYVERAVGGRVTPVSLPPPRQAGIIDFGRVFVSIGTNAPSLPGVGITIIKFDGTTKPGFPQTRNVTRGRSSAVFELEGGGNPDAVFVVNLFAFPPSVEVSVLVETDSP
jgi:hypothetical protein